MSRVLVDTSVWVEMFREGDRPAVNALRELLHGGLVCTIGLIRAELLSGTKSRKDYDRLDKHFSALPLLPDPPSMWDVVALTRYRLARRGFQASIADLVIAVSACHHRKALFSLDRAFRQISRALPLELFRPAEYTA